MTEYVEYKKRSAIALSTSMLSTADGRYDDPYEIAVELYGSKAADQMFGDDWDTFFDDIGDDSEETDQELYANRPSRRLRDDNS